MKRTQELLIIDVWKPMDKEVVGAPELESIQETIAERFGTSVSPASIARALADHGVRLGHPEILQTDLHWRERNQLFTPEDLVFGTIDAANALVDKIESLGRQFPADWFGKLKMFAQCLAVGTVVGMFAFGFEGSNYAFWSRVAHVSVWATLLTSVGSCISYLVKTRRFILEGSR